MSELYQRIKQARENAKLTQEQLAKLLDVSKSAVALWESKNPSNRTNPTFDKMKVIAEKTRCNLNWLLTGNQNEQPSGISTDEVDEESESFRIEFAAVKHFDKSVSETNHLLFFRQAWLEARIGENGDPMVATVSGDAMSPRIKDGDIVLIDASQNDLTDGRIFAFKHNDSLMIRKIHLNWDGSIKMEASNSNTEVISKDQANDLDIIGRVIWVGGDI